MHVRSNWINREICRRWAPAHITLGISGLLTVGLMLIFHNVILLFILVIPVVVCVRSAYQSAPPRLEREYDGMHHEEPEYRAYLRMMQRTEKSQK